ncbi:MAG: GIY-YIG nuclease family protein [Bacteroidales bacterium]|nr:GIY-YIG nuclease family protein [Bacteroidales bacterium]
MYTVYVIYSKSHNKIYIGYTSDIEQRLIAHNHPRNKGWTKRFAPWILIYSEIYCSKPVAMTREKQLKTCRGREIVWKEVANRLQSTGG